MLRRARESADFCRMIKSLDKDRATIERMILGIQASKKDKEKGERPEAELLRVGEILEEIGDQDEYLNDLESLRKHMASNIGELETLTRLSSDVDCLNDVQEKTKKEAEMDRIVVDSLFASIEENKSVLSKNIQGLKDRMAALTK